MTVAQADPAVWTCLDDLTLLLDGGLSLVETVSVAFLFVFFGGITQYASHSRSINNNRSIIIIIMKCEYISTWKCHWQLYVYSINHAIDQHAVLFSGIGCISTIILC